MHFVKAHAYGNDFIYVIRDAAGHGDLPSLAREMCARHTGIGADGLIVYAPTSDGASMRLFNADGSFSEVSGNGVRGLAAILLDRSDRDRVTIQTEGGVKALTRTGRDGIRQIFRAAMGLPEDLRQVPLTVDGESITVAAFRIGNPQCVVLGRLPVQARFDRVGQALAVHPYFPDGTNVEFAELLAPDRVTILIWERGVGPTTSSGTGSCAALIASAAFGGAARDAQVVAPGGTQRVEWRDDSVYLTGWAEIVCEGEWLKNPRT